ncbi:MAG: glycoside hydrolase family 127 protein, partial [Alistipes sp.]|nr:glycoside hydrolase family 127 protein [Alistipes sp.]
MKFSITTLIFCAMFLSVSYTAQAQIAVESPIKQVKIAGSVGERIDDCIEHRVKAQDVEHLVEPFRHRTEGGRWQSEFWGKWVQGAIASYRYNRDPELYEIIRRSVDGMISTQTAEGYIGNYKEEDQLKQWDVWGRKYTCLGLVAWYDLSGEKRALEAACRVLDHLMTQVGPTSQSKRGIASTGNYRGMASCSNLEPVVYIYNRTKQAKYL